MGRTAGTSRPPAAAATARSCPRVQALKAKAAPGQLADRLGRLVHGSPLVVRDVDDLVDARDELVLDEGREAIDPLHLLCVGFA